MKTFYFIQLMLMANDVKTVGMVSLVLMDMAVTVKWQFLGLCIFANLHIL